ncbi:hypothetical protein PFLmoz3_06355 [Pseudomonas fluorescens]|uniref:Uncharacterized protein n=1 Tax=Pseudomonas fluorescens TaxID=294 RepID=A0A125QC72_PSEFL|nr:hypothetical protein PFLmoz3_06355 [Pseudomonas fluorescens]
MVSDFMTVLDHRFDRGRILLNAPGRNEECLFQTQVPVGLQDSRYADFRSVLQG